MITYGSLFAGIGGLDLGLERAGMECKWQVEIDDYATKVLERHWPNVRRWRDITTFPPNASSIRCDTRVAEQSLQGTGESCQTPGWQVDLICGGFPCQDISYAGRGAGLEGDRSGLFFEAIRVVRQLRPRYVLLENVAALLSRGLDRVLGELGQIGYDCEWHCIPAASVGAPHIRDRVFIIAYADNAGSRTSKSRIDGLRQSPQDTRQQESLIKSGRYSSEGGDWWETEPAVGRVAHGVPDRMDRLKCLGNAVVPQVAEWIGKQIVEYDDLTTNR